MPFSIYAAHTWFSTHFISDFVITARTPPSREGIILLLVDMLKTLEIVTTRSPVFVRTLHMNTHDVG